MQDFKLISQQGHLFITIDENCWLLDTGAPVSFGLTNLEIENQFFSINTGYMGLTAEKLSEFVGFQTAGIIGTDILNQFDVVFDSLSATVSFYKDEFVLEGDALALTDFMGIPIVQVKVNDVMSALFFDTGAQVSYYQSQSLNMFPSLGNITDFYPGFGSFQTETYQVSMLIGKTHYQLRCGALPGLLGMSLGLAGVEGIVGNEIMTNRVIGYFARRSQLVLA